MSHHGKMAVPVAGMVLVLALALGLEAAQGQAEIPQKSITFVFQNPTETTYLYWLYLLSHHIPELKGRALNIAGGELGPGIKHVSSGPYDPGPYIICWRVREETERACHPVYVLPNTREIQFTPIGARGWLWEQT